MNKTKAMLGSGKIFQSVHFGASAHREILEGASILYEAVKSTMGPSGHNVIIENGITAPLITKDGVTVAKSINLKKKLPSIGAELLKEIASKTNELAGDGPQPLYSKVLTPNGWKTMEELKIGDEICGTNNTIQKVLEIHPKGIKDVYKLTTSDGREVECCENHLWKIVMSHGQECVSTTKQLLENGVIKYKKNNLKRYRYYIPNTCVEFYDNSDKLPIDPYLLGALLGDGSLPKAKGSCVEISIGLKEEYILDRIKLPEGCSFSKTIYPNKNYIAARIIGTNNKKPIIKEILSKLGLLGTYSDTKFIPKQYLYSTVENRKKLLDGLIDTDGYINERGLFGFNTVSEQLNLDFIELCRSLGIQTCCYQEKRKPNSGSYSNKPIYRIIQLKGYKYGLKIKKIEKTDKQTEMQCIKVSNEDHLYITDDYVTTHNTTTATVVGYAMLSQGTKMVATGRSSIGLKRGMDHATNLVIEHLKKEAIQVRNNDDIVNVGTISANGDKQIGKLICDAINKVGQDGIITIEPAKSVQTTLEVVEGMQIESGYTSPYFVTNQEKLTCELQEPLVLITNKKLTSLSELLPALELANEQNLPLLLVGDEIDGEVLHTLIVNKMKGVLFSCAIRAPSYGDNRTDLLQDIALVTGGTVFDASSGSSLKSIKTEDFGRCKKVIVGRNFTTFVGEGGEDIKSLIEERVNQLRSVLTNDLSLDDLRRNNLKKRLAKLAGGIAVIKVGGSTEVEILEKKDRVEDALNATVAAVQEGVLPGGGTALFYAKECLNEVLKNSNNIFTDDELAGVRVIYETCKQPLRVIVENTGKSADVVMNNLSQKQNFKVPEMDMLKADWQPTGNWKVLYENAKKETKSCDPMKFGYDAYKHEYGDLVESGVLDPIKVQRCAMEHSCSVIGLLLTCNSFIVNEDIEEIENE